MVDGAVAGPAPVTVHNAFGETEAFVVDLGKRVVYTAAEGAAAAGVVAWGGSGLGVHDLVTLSGLEKFWVIVAVAALGAFLAGARATVSGFFAVQANRDRAKLLAEDDVVEAENYLRNRGKHSASSTSATVTVGPIKSGGGAGGGGGAALVTGSGQEAQAIQAATVAAPEQGAEYLTDDSADADAPITDDTPEPAQADAPVTPAKADTIPVYNADGNRVGDVPASALINGSAS